MNPNSKSINLDVNSVVSLTDSNIPFVSGRTFKVGEAYEGMKRHFGRSDVWFSEGLDCEALVPGDTWRKGRIRICFEFCPEDDEDEENISEKDFGHKETADEVAVEYPLDEVRQTI